MFLLLLSPAIQVAAISWADLQVFYCEGCVVFGKRPVCIPKYHFAKLSFCQNVILPEYHAAKIVCCQNIKTEFSQISSCQKFVICCNSGSSFVGSTKSLLKDDGSTGTITPCKRARHQLDPVDLQEDSKDCKNWIKSCPKLTKDDGSSGTITLGPDWYLRNVRLAITGDDGSTGTITPSDCTKCGVWGRPILQTFWPINLRTNCGKLIFGKTQFWYFGNTIFWQHDILAKKHSGKMIVWQNDIWGCTPAVFQKRHNLHSKTLANRLKK